MKTLDVARKVRSRVQEQRQKTTEAIESLYQQTLAGSQPTSNSHRGRTVTSGGGSSSNTDFRRLSGFQASQNAVSGPIDLRSLSARPEEGKFVIRKDYTSSRNPNIQRNSGPRSTGGFQRNGNRPQGGRPQNGRFRNSANRSQGVGTQRRTKNKIRSRDKTSTRNPGRDLTPLEQEYLRQKEEAAKPHPVNFIPSAPSLDTLTGLGPTIPVTDFGSTETLEARLHSLSLDRRVSSDATLVSDQAARLLSGGFVHFGSEAEKEEVLALAHEVTARRRHAGASSAESSSSGSEGKGKEGKEEGELAFETLSEEEREKFVEALFSGRYKSPGAGEQGWMGDVERMAWKNETYRVRDEDALKAKVRGIVAVGRAAARAPRKAVSEA